MVEHAVDTGSDAFFTQRLGLFVVVDAKPVGQVCGQGDAVVDDTCFLGSLIHNPLCDPFRFTRPRRGLDDVDTRLRVVDLLEVLYRGNSVPRNLPCAQSRLNQPLVPTAYLLLDDSSNRS